METSSLLFLLSLLTQCVCMKWTCGNHGCFAVSDAAMSWNDAVAECRKQDAFLISPKHDASVYSGVESWSSLRRYHGQFFFQSIEQFPRFYRSLSEVETPFKSIAFLYNDNLLCFTINYNTMASSNCTEKSKFVCERHGIPESEYPDFSDLKLALSANSTATKDDYSSRRCYHNEYLQYAIDDVTGPDLSIDCRFSGNQYQRIPESSSINLLCNGYYTGMTSPPWKFDMSSLRQYNILMSRDNLATAQIQCAAWIPGQVEPLLSQKVIVRFDSRYNDYFLYTKLVKVNQVPGLQGKRATEILRNARLVGVDNISQELKAATDNFGFWETNWFLADMTSEEDKEELKLKLIAVDWNKAGSTRSTMKCIDDQQEDILTESCDRLGSSAKCLNQNGELIIQKCECDLLDGALPTYHLGRTGPSLPKPGCASQQQRRALYCPEGFQRIEGGDNCFKVIGPDTWERTFSDCFLYKDHQDTDFEDDFLRNSRKQLPLEYSEYWLLSRRWLPFTRILSIIPNKENSTQNNFEAHTFQWEENEPNITNNCVKVNIHTQKLISEQCDKTLPMLCIISSRSRRLSGSCENGWDGIYDEVEEKMSCLKIFPRSFKDEEIFTCSKMGGLITGTALNYSKGKALISQILSSPYQFRECRFDSTNQTKFDNQCSLLENSGLLPPSYFLVTDDVVSITLARQQEESTWSFGTQANCIICEKKMSLSVRTRIHISVTPEGSLSFTVKDPKNMKGNLVCFRDMDTIFYDTIHGSDKDQYFRKLDDEISYNAEYVCIGWSYSLKRLIISNTYVQNEETISVTAAVLWEGDSEYYTSAVDPIDRQPNMSTEFEHLLNYDSHRNYELRLIRFQNSSEGKLQALYHLTRYFPGRLQNITDFVNEYKGIEALVRATGLNIKYIKSTDFCFRESSYINQTELSWPTTLVGSSTASEKLYKASNGYLLLRSCFWSIEGAYWERGTVTEELHQIFVTNVTNENIEEVIQKTNTLTSRSENLTAEDVSLVAGVLTQISRNVKVRKSEIPKVLSVVNNMLSIEDKDIFSKIQLDSANKIIQALEDIVLNCDAALDNETRSIEIVSDNIAVGISKVDEMGRAGFAVLGNESMSYEESTVTSMTSLEDVNQTSLSVGIIFPNCSLRPDDTVVFITYRTHNFFKRSHDDQNIPNLFINSQVISSQLKGRYINNLSTPVQILFNPLSAKDNNTDVKCVFWNFTIGEFAGGWSDVGCRFKESLGDLDICECDHLTHFAELVYINGQVPEIHGEILNTITKIGCGLSIVGLVGSIVISLMPKTRKIRDLKKEEDECQRETALFNLSLALFFVMVIFLSGFDSKVNNSVSAGCIVVAVLLHYFILASFHWMLVLAVLLYLAVAHVFGNVSGIIRKSKIFAWGVPGVFVTITLSISTNNYTTIHNYCWMSGYALYLSFLLPISIVMLVNVAVFAFVFRQVLLRLNMQDKKEKRTATVKKLKSAMTLFMLLGLSWVSGFFMVGALKLVFSYIFCIAVTLQGVFILYYSITTNESFKRNLQNCIPGMNQIVTSLTPLSSAVPEPSKDFSETSV